jgi:hypothetical protein
MQKHSNAATRRWSSTREEEIAEHVRSLLALVNLGFFNLEQVRQILVRHFKYRVRVDVFDEGIRSRSGGSDDCARSETWRSQLLLTR